MAVAAEVLETNIVQSLEFQVTPLVFEVPDRPEDLLARNQAERLIQHAGKLALQGVVERPFVEVEPPSLYPTLMQALHEASKGDPEAKKVVTANVQTDVIERTIKAGMVMKVPLQIDDQGKLMQYGQSMDDVQINTLLYCNTDPAVKPRFEAEARNNARIERYNRQGVLDEYCFVVISRAADDMSQEAMTAAGFFTDTMSCSIQATYVEEGQLVTESAFVAGKKSPEDGRHDKATIIKMAANLGADFTDKSAAEIIDTPLLIHRSLMPNGVVDMVKQYDNAAGNTFFGQDKPAKDYEEYLVECKQRETELKPVVDKIVDQLVSESMAIWTPIAATQRLHELSQQQMVERSITDTTIDPKVFGITAAAYIEQARLWNTLGDGLQSQASLKSAQGTARSASCPNGSNGAGAGMDGSNESAAEDSGKSEIKRMTCPFCGDSKQYGDPCSPNQHCTSCKATVTAGKVTSTGDGGKSKREKHKQGVAT